MSIVLVGLNHKTAPIELREQFYLPGCGKHMAMEELKNTISRAAEDPTRPGIDEAVTISTCNRLEIYAAAKDTETGYQAIEEYLSRLQGISMDELRPYLYRKADHEALDHLFRVACGLDSMILGETQILGQVQQAVIEAKNAATIGIRLSQVFTRAVRSGKRARTETGISRWTTSVSHAAVQMAESMVGDISDHHVLLVGAGEMAEIAGQALLNHGATRISVLNRTFCRSQRLATRIKATPLNWFHFKEAMKDADIVITATDAPHILVYEKELLEVMPGRNGRPLLFIDIAVPRNVEPTVAGLDNVSCVDIDQLQSVVDSNRAQREAEIPKIESIVREEIEHYDTWVNSRKAAPVIVDLRNKIRELIEAETMQAMKSMDAKHSKEILKLLTHRVSNRILHEPTIRLKAHEQNGNSIAFGDAIRELFALDENQES
jgi:glutamyl-tRNA reductase